MLISSLLILGECIYAKIKETNSITKRKNDKK